MQYCNAILQYFFRVLQKYCNTFLKLKYWTIAILFLSEKYCNTFWTKNNNLEQSLSPFWIKRLKIFKEIHVNNHKGIFHLLWNYFCLLVIILKNYSVYEWILYFAWFLKKVLKYCNIAILSWILKVLQNAILQYFFNQVLQKVLQYFLKVLTEGLLPKCIVLWNKEYSKKVLQYFLQHLVEKVLQYCILQYF